MNNLEADFHDPRPAKPFRWGRWLALLFGLAVLVSLLAIAFRWQGDLKFAREAARVEALIPPPLESRARVAGTEEATPILVELEALLDSDRIDLAAPAGSEEGLDARTALREILASTAASEEAWSTYEAQAARLGEALAMLDRLGERPRWDHGPSEGERMFLEFRAWKLKPLVPWVAAAAVHAARSGDAALAERRLRQAFHLSGVARGLSSLSAFTTFAGQRCVAFEGLAAVLRHRPESLDDAWLTGLIEDQDLSALHARALAGDFHTYLESYRAGDPAETLTRALLVSIGAPGASRTEFPDGLWLLALTGGHDAALFVERAAWIHDLGQGSLADAVRVVEDLEQFWGPAPWYAPLASFVAGQLTVGFPAWIDLESHLRLARIVLEDRRRGREAALELLERTVDPADDQPVLRRAESDGSLTMWCLGSDLLDLDGSALDGDIVWSLPARR